MSGQAKLLNPCWQRDAKWACWTDPVTGDSQTVVIHFRYDSNGIPVIAETPNSGAPNDLNEYFTDIDGAILDINSVDVTPGICKVKMSCETGYAVLENNDSWTPPADTKSITIQALSGNLSTITTPNGTGSISRGTSKTWTSTDDSEIDFTGFTVTSGGASHRVEIHYTISQ